jgi:hypothetical protein
VTKPARLGGRKLLKKNELGMFLSDAMIRVSIERNLDVKPMRISLSTFCFFSVDPRVRIFFQVGGKLLVIDYARALSF